jgi:hypothetical protein
LVGGVEKQIVRLCRAAQRMTIVQRRDGDDVGIAAKRRFGLPRVARRRETDDGMNEP